MKQGATRIYVKAGKPVVRVKMDADGLVPSDWKDAVSFALETVEREMGKFGPMRWSVLGTTTRKPTAFAAGHRRNP